MFNFKVNPSLWLYNQPNKKNSSADPLFREPSFKVLTDGSCCQLLTQIDASLRLSEKEIIGAKTSLLCFIDNQWICHQGGMVQLFVSVTKSGQKWFKIAFSFFLSFFFKIKTSLVCVASLFDTPRHKVHLQCWYKKYWNLLYKKTLSLLVFDIYITHT